MIILDEELHALLIAGGALVLLGLWMVQSRPAGAQASPAAESET